MKNIIALISGLIFALGLVLSGMTQPAKVIGFLDITGNWDPSLAFVMGGAVLITLIAFAITTRAGKRPWFADKFELPTRTDIDVRLIGGSALFGIGWALVGYCPGPAFASLLVGGTDIVIFMLAMMGGMYLAKRISGKSPITKRSDKR
ncbi:MAG: YeeE/YedE family protein [Cytophagales bacterium]|nr:YeeE/YedE family protein [Cytophagales bacterium]